MHPQFRHIALRYLVPVLVAAPCLTTALAAQAAPDARRNELTLDASLPGLAVGYAVPTGGTGRLLGVQLGIGGDWINRTLGGPAHFTENGGDQIVEFGHVAVFVRQHVGTRGAVDVGMRLAPFVHGNDLDDDVAFGGFAGAYVTPMVHWGRFSVGPRILVGYFVDDPDYGGFGVNVAPLVGRVTFGR
jgi:hypothetical protein